MREAKERDAESSAVSSFSINFGRSERSMGEDTVVLILKRRRTSSWTQTDQDWGSLLLG